MCELLARFRVWVVKKHLFKTHVEKRAVCVSKTHNSETSKPQNQKWNQIQVDINVGMDNMEGRCLKFGVEVKDTAVFCASRRLRWAGDLSAEGAGVRVRSRLERNQKKKVWETRGEMIHNVAEQVILRTHSPIDTKTDTDVEGGNSNWVLDGDRASGAFLMNAQRNRTAKQNKMEWGWDGMGWNGVINRTVEIWGEK